MLNRETPPPPSGPPRLFQKHFTKENLSRTYDSLTDSQFLHAYVKHMKYVYEE